MHQDMIEAIKNEIYCPGEDPYNRPCVTITNDIHWIIITIDGESCSSDSCLAANCAIRVGVNSLLPVLELSKPLDTIIELLSFS